jgi:hypothetical protein
VVYFPFSISHNRPTQMKSAGNLPTHQKFLLLFIFSIWRSL